jgi:hypothetical protein
MTSTSLDLSQIKTDAIASAASFRALVGVGERNEADGFVGVEEDGTVSAIVTVRQGTAAELNEIVLAAGEIAIQEKTGVSPTLRIGNGVMQGGRELACSVVVVDTNFNIIDRNTTFAININKNGLGVEDAQIGEEFLLSFPSIEDQSCYFSFPVLFSATIAGVTLKTTTGDRSTNVIGEIVINTFDNNIKMYADGGWRTLASW